MLCLEKLEQLIKDEIKYNVKACNIKQDCDFLKRKRLCY